MVEPSEQNVREADNDESYASIRSKSTVRGPNRAPIGQPYHCLEPGCECNYRPIHQGTPDSQHAKRVHKKQANEITFVECVGEDCHQCSQNPDLPPMRNGKYEALSDQKK